MKFGLDRLLASRALRKGLRGKRVALLAHPASVTRDLTHALDALAALPDVELAAAFGPQHGLRGDKQDNMVESPDFTDPEHGIPVFSLYGAVRRPTAAMMSTFDVLLVDLQDVGCRIYTFITTLRYVLEEAARHGKAVWVLDRPNPIGRPDRGFAAAPRLGELRRRGPAADAARPDDGRARAVVRRDVAPQSRLPRRRNARLGARRGARATAGRRRARVDQPEPERRRCSNRRVAIPAPSWSRARRCPKAAARRGRSSSFGAPDIDASALHRADARARAAVAARLRMRECWFEPTFQKHVGELCAGMQIHVEEGDYSHAAFRPWRLQALMFKALRMLEPKYPLWRDFPYEYERDRLAIDLMNGSDLLRRWVDDRRSTPKELDDLARADERAWQRERRPFLLY